MKPWGYILIGILILLILIYVGAVHYVFRLLFGRSKEELLLTKVDNLEETHYKDYIEVVHTVIHSFEEKDYEDVFIKSYDGIQLHGRYYSVPNSKKLAIFLHGYHADPINNTAPYAVRLFQEGYSILMITERAHGRSEGKYITFGILEQKDGQSWISYAEETYHPESIVLFGVSMGCSTIEMMSDHLPSTVKAMVLDCGFTGVYEQILYTLKRHVKGLTYILMPGLYLHSILCRFPLAKGTAKKALSKTNVPAFFIHGKKDKLVPYSMGVENYEACSSIKKMISNDCGHAINGYAAMDTINQELYSFLEQFIK